MEAPAASELSRDRQEAANLAVDIADTLVAQSLDFAQNSISFGEAARRDLLTLATAHAQVAATVYIAHELTAALREVNPEIAGAISEAGTDIGAGIAECLQRALNTNTHDKTDNT